MGKTLFDKIWDLHTIKEIDENTSLIAIDRIYLHDLCGAFAFQMLNDSGHDVLRPESVIASPDHTISTKCDRTGLDTRESRSILPRLRTGCEKYGVKLHDINDEKHGIVHIMGCQQGYTLPGMSLLCGDSHTCTHGAMGALTFGVGTSQVYHALATSCIKVRRPRTLRICINGVRGDDIGPMDIILSIIRRFGISRGVGYAIEYCGSVVEGMTMEERFTLCNLTIEMGAEYGIIAPDNTTLEYIRESAPMKEEGMYEKLTEHCRTLTTDPDAEYDDYIDVDITGLKRQVTWGINPGQAADIDGQVPGYCGCDEGMRASLQKAWDYMGYGPGTSMGEVPVSYVFIGACSNGTLSVIRTVAQLVKGRNVAPGVFALVVPGSEKIKRDAEKENLDVILKEAGFAWGAPGCGLCCGSNGEYVPGGLHCVSTTNRNFIGRQGPGARTHLASPVTAAKAALFGRIV